MLYIVKGGICLYMVNTNGKNLEGVPMDSNLIIRIDKELKEQFREAAKRRNPQLSDKTAMSAVLRKLMIDYINEGQPLPPPTPQEKPKFRETKKKPKVDEKRIGMLVEGF
jgi:hypothetical protein